MPTLGPKPDSKRSKRRSKRNFTASRPQRRAERRLGSALAGYQNCVKLSKAGGKEFTKPGAEKHW